LQSNDWGTHLNSRQNHSYLAALNYGQVSVLFTPEFAIHGISVLFTPDFTIYGICCAALKHTNYSSWRYDNPSVCVASRSQSLHVARACTFVVILLKHFMNSHPRSLLALSTHDFSDLSLRILLLRRLFTTTA
jgi:hypothetical protein